MARDIEEFLRMAAQRRQEQKNRAAGRRADATPAAARPPIQRPPTSGPRTLRPGEEIRVLADEPATDMREQSVSDHVRTHLDTSDLVDHATQLGEEVGMADDKLDARLQMKFDHSVASLRSGSSVQDTTTTTTERRFSPLAMNLLNMLRSPESISQAILISEVLRRPDFDD